MKFQAMMIAFSFICSKEFGMKEIGLKLIEVSKIKRAIRSLRLPRFYIIF